MESKEDREREYTAFVQTRVLGRSPGTVKSQTSLGLARLREMLPGYRNASR